MNATAEDIARLEFERLTDSGVIRVRVPVCWKYGFCLPAIEGEEVDGTEEAIFREMTVGDNLIIEVACTSDIVLERGIKMAKIDVNEMRRIIIKRHLLNWSLSIPIERQDGWITDECYEKVANIPGPLLDSFLSGFEEKTEIDHEERERIIKQSVVLFSKNSQGVMGACEAIRLFCMYSRFSEKFGLDRDSVLKMPYREYIRLKQVMEKESEAMLRNNPKSHSTSNTRIVGPGGRSRPSRAVRVPDR